MIEIRKKSAIPIYGAAAVYAVYALIFPLYKLSHFMWGAIAAIAAYFILSKLIPDKVERIEKEPEYTGDELVDGLLKQGREAVINITELSQDIKSPDIREKAEKIASLTEKIFENLLTAPEGYQNIKRFSDYFLPATLKLLRSYSELESLGADGENIGGTKARISDILDTTVSAYEKQLDALFANKSLDIETDIEVMRGMMKSQGLTDSDFNI